MITKDKLIKMVELQDRLNKVVNPNWMSANYPWHRAIMVESVEALDHYGWKWWKKQEPNLAQTQMELVDIFHFILSMALENNGGDYDKTAEAIKNIFYTPDKPTDKDTVVLFDLMAGYAAEGKICVPAFVHLMQELDLSWEQMYTSYISKNVLNVFRQDHGYQAGSYRKDWDGMEDNAVLADIMKALPDATPEVLYDHLEATYSVMLSMTK